MTAASHLMAKRQIIARITHELGGRYAPFLNRLEVRELSDLLHMIEDRNAEHRHDLDAARLRIPFFRGGSE